MPILKNKIEEILRNKDLTIYKLNKLIDYDESSLNKAIKLKMSFPYHIIEKLLPVLEVSKEEFTAWIIADKYSEEVIQIAINELKCHLGNKVSILTKNIDKILLEKTLSRTAVSKLINYSQSSFNRMITGQIPMSKTVMLKLVPVIEINESTIQGWILADKYSLTILESAVNNLNNQSE